MKQITLPGLVNKRNLNWIFVDYCHTHKEYLIDEKTYFIAYGTVPQNSWGSYRNLLGTLLLYPEITSIINTYNNKDIRCRFDCGNLIIDPNDYNVFGRVMLDCGDNGSNQIEIATIDAYNFFSSHYPNYNYIGSQNMIDFSPNMNLLAVVRDIHNDETIPYSIEHLVCSPCENCTQEQYTRCSLQEMLNINNFSEQTLFNCHQMKTFNKIIPIKHYNRIQIGEYNNTIDQLWSYIYHTFKPEFYLTAYTDIITSLMIQG